jgi:hypothetical protein
VQRPYRFFRGSELPRLLFLAAIMIVGWALAWQFAHKMNQPPEPELTVSGKPEPVVADHSIEFETVTDRTPLQFRDDAAYSLLLSRARGRSPEELASLARRDIVLAHLWQNPELYRGVPVHLLGSTLRVLRYPSKLSQNGWLYEACIITPENTRLPYVCVFEDAPKGLPIGPNVSERVVFNGYFLKIWKYQAADVARGAPILVGRIGWQPGDPPASQGNNSLLRWSLIIVGVLFFVSLARWIFQLKNFLNPPTRSPLISPQAVSEEIDPASLDAWVQSVAPQDESLSDHDGPDAG